MPSKLQLVNMRYDALSFCAAYKQFIRHKQWRHSVYLIAKLAPASSSSSSSLGQQPQQPQQQRRHRKSDELIRDNREHLRTGLTERSADLVSGVLFVASLSTPTFHCQRAPLTDSRRKLQAASFATPNFIDIPNVAFIALFTPENCKITIFYYIHLYSPETAA